MKRMLFIFAKLNPGVSYIQGMNEVLAPLYYTFMTDTVKNSDIYPAGFSIEPIHDFDQPDNVEADTFWCFMQLMGEIRDGLSPLSIRASRH